LTYTLTKLKIKKEKLKIKSPKPFGWGFFCSIQECNPAFSGIACKNEVFALHLKFSRYQFPEFLWSFSLCHLFKRAGSGFITIGDIGNGLEKKMWDKRLF